MRSFTLAVKLLALQLLAAGLVDGQKAQKENKAALVTGDKKTALVTGNKKAGPWPKLDIQVGDKFVDVSDAPSLTPSDAPSLVPSSMPSDAPSMVPSDAPSIVPSSAPSDAPSLMPSNAPSTQPSDAPSLVPSSAPSSLITGLPTQALQIDDDEASPIQSSATATSTALSAVVGAACLFLM